MTTYFSPEERDILENQLGFKRYDPESDTKFLCGLPGTSRYNLITGLYMATTGFMYLRARKIGAVTGPSALAFGLGPLCYRWDLSTFDYGKRYDAQTVENLGQQLEQSPLTRNAWIEALIENKKFNTALKQRIAELELEKASMGADTEEAVEDEEDEDDDDED